MNAFAMFAADEALRLASERVEGYRQEQAAWRLAARASKGSRFASISGAVSSFRSALSSAKADQALPALNNYPYRS
jgi:hypothetical protein